MKSIKKINYYTYFLVLSLMLISGYLVLSLVSLNRSQESGKQAGQYGKTVDKINAIIQHSSQLETAAYSYLITRNNQGKAVYRKEKEQLSKNVEGLGLHCSKHHFANHETAELSDLIAKRIHVLDQLTASDTLLTDSQIEEVLVGDEYRTEILNTLQKIRKENNDLKEANQMEAEKANRHTFELLASFGIIMLIIVFISFFKMRQELRRSQQYLKEINQINLELSAANKNLESFAYVASHDLNEPLRKISAFGNMVLENIDKDRIENKEIRTYIERINHSSERMKTLIQDILKFAKTTRKESVNEWVNFDDLMENVKEDLQVSIEESKAIIGTENLPKNIQAISSQMQRLFQNLISNSIKFSKENSSPVIKIVGEKIVDSDKLPSEIVVHQDLLPYWKITVTDNGKGFDNQYAEDIFSLFHRLQGRSACEGTGIGLAICKKICENHLGTILASSNNDEGATFTIYLPEKQKV